MSQTEGRSPLPLILAAIAAIVAVVVILFLTGIVGGGDDDGGTTATQPGAPGATTAPGTTPAASGDSVTGSNLRDLNSYRYTVKFEGSGAILGELTQGLGAPGAAPTQNFVMEITGAYVKPDKGQMTMKFAGLEFSQTIIGNQQWSSFGGVSSGPMPANAGPEDLSFIHNIWDSEIKDFASKFNCSGRENVNGVSAIKCTADKATLEQFAGDMFGAGSGAIRELTTQTFNVWMAPQGYPVRIRSEVAGKDTRGGDFRAKFDADLTDINSSAVTVTAPTR